MRLLIQVLILCLIAVVGNSLFRVSASSFARAHLAKDVSREISYQLDEKGQYKSPGFRLFKSFISLAKASALRDGRTIVSSNDIGRIKYLSHWMNLKMNALNQEYPDDFRRFI